MAFLVGAPAPLTWAESGAAAPWTLEASPDLSTDGVYQLRWKGAAGPVVLEEAATEAFVAPRVVYRGEARATVVSGRASGIYHYRIRRPESGREAALALTEVTVEHHSLARAFGFFAAGLFVFLATVWLVLGGSDAPDASEGSATR